MLRPVHRRYPNLFAAALGAVLLFSAVTQARVVARHTAEMAGLSRAWFTQVTLDPAIEEVVGAKLSGGTLYVLTSAGTLQALDAESGVERWTSRLGSSRLGFASNVVLGPAVERYPSKDADGVETTLTRCAVAVGSRLYVLKENDLGVETEMTIEVAGAPGAAPVLGDDYVYIPAVSGRLLAYPFDQVMGVPFKVASPGALSGDPIVSQGRVIWSTSRGELYGAPASGGGPAYRFDASAPLSGPPSVTSDIMYFATTQGIVYAMQPEKARQVWRTSVGGGIPQPVIAVGGVVYIATDAPALWACDAATGKRLWTVEGLSSLVSSTDKRVYAVAPNGAVGVLDRETGRPVASWPAVGELTPVVNTETDRLYFVSSGGLVQCFHEEGRDKPYRHDGAGAEPAAEAPANADEAADTAADDEEPAMDLEDEPAAEEPADSGLDPFAPPAEDPPPAAADDDPFADF